MLPEEFKPPGAVEVSVAALQLARDFSDTIGAGDYVATFDWAQSIGIRQKTGAPLQQIGACLMLGAYKRNEVPAAYVQYAEQLAYAIRIPTDVWKRSVRRMIDVDESLPIRLALR
jgi:hypothetical protein